VELLPAFGADAFPVIMELYQHPGNRQRAATVKALGNFVEPTRPALRRLRPSLTDEDARVRLQAARAVWKLEKDENAVLPKCGSIGAYDVDQQIKNRQPTAGKNQKGSERKPTGGS